VVTGRELVPSSSVLNVDNAETVDKGCIDDWMTGREEEVTSEELEAANGMIAVSGYCVTVTVLVDVEFPQGRDSGGPLVKFPSGFTHGGGFDSIVGALGVLFW